jgi:CRP-like cAMP-binding protein
MDVVVHHNPIIASLAACPLFKAVEWRTIQGLAKAARLCCFERGQHLFHAGDSDYGLFLIRSGQVKLSMLASSGTERVIEVISPGGTLGEEGVFASLPSRVNAEMLTKGEIIEIPGECLKELLRGCPTLASSMLRHLAVKVQRFVGELENCCLRSAGQRVIEYLLSLAGEQRAGERGRLSIQLPASKGVVASLLDITPETFSRELNRLIGMGLIRVERKTIELLDLERLRQAGQP